ncbi:MAG TPA: hypothetical protein VGN26_16835 [Armatimonadota bacterium]
MLERAGTIGRGWLYLALAVVVAASVARPFAVGVDPGTQARGVFNAIERVPKGRLVVLNFEYDAGTEGENGPQARALITHLMRRGIPFAILSLDTLAGPTFGQALADELGRRYHRVEGRDWVNWGYKPPLDATLAALARDIPATIQRDFRGRVLSSLPLMRGIRSGSDLGMVVDITPGSSFESWLRYFTSQTGVPFAVSPTAVMGPTVYPYLDSGQAVGMLMGVRGAAEYEALLGSSGPGRRRLTPVIATHILLVALILLGNAGEWARRRSLRAAEGSA